MKKRGQVTVYLIIIALIVIMVAISVLQKEDVSIPENSEETVEIPQMLLPVNEIVEQCIFEESKKALDILMSHGGFVFTENLDTNPVFSTEGDAVEYMPGTNFPVPYWYYMKSGNDCTGNCEFSSMKKPLSGENSMEMEIERHIDENLHKCVSGFSSLKDQGYEINVMSLPVSSVLISSDSLVVKVEYPVEVTFDSSVNHMSQFTATLPTFLTEFYEAASEITDYESSNCFVDTHMINAISMYSGLESDLPPFYAVTDDIENVIWVKQKVEEKLKQLTSSYVQIIRVGNSSTNPYPDINTTGSRYPQMAQTISDRFVFYPFSKYRNVRVNFMSNPFWQPYFDVKPSTDSIIAPSEVIEMSSNPLSSLVGTLTTKTYQFGYRYSFPTIVELRKYSEFYNEDRVFRFALEGNIRANRCFHPGASITTISSGGQSLLCDDDFFADIERKITIKDDFTGNGIQGAEVKFYGGVTCPLGITDSNGTILTRLPSAENGFLKFEKQGYLNTIIHESDFTFPMTIRLKPKFELDYSLNLFGHETYEEMFQSADPLAVRDSGIFTPSANHTVIATLTRTKESYMDQDFVQTISFVDGEMLPESIELAEGKYEVLIQLFETGNFLLEEEKDHICVEDPDIDFISWSCYKTPVDSACDDMQPVCNLLWNDVIDFDAELDQECFQLTECYKSGFRCEGDDCIMDEEIVYDSVELSTIPNGGALLNGTHTVRFDNEDLNISSNLKLYILRQKPITRHHELGEMVSDYKDKSLQAPYAFRPRLE